jgi:hypothetical protein
MPFGETALSVAGREAVKTIPKLWKRGRAALANRRANNRRPFEVLDELEAKARLAEMLRRQVRRLDRKRARTWVPNWGHAVRGLILEVAPPQSLPYGRALLEPAYPDLPPLTEQTKGVWLSYIDRIVIEIESVTRPPA